MTQLMDAVSGIFLEVLGTDMIVIEEYFPFVSKAFTVMQYTAWALLFLIVVWQLFRSFGGPLTEAENPWQLLARGALFAVLIGYAKQVFLFVLNIARAPYTALLDISMDASDFTFAGIEEVLKNGLMTIVSMVSIVGTILLIILMICLGWNYFKLLLETVERYILAGVLCYTSPLAFAMGASQSTGKVFQSWCRMVGSQLLLLVMNVWFLRAFNSSVGHFIANGGALSNGKGSIFLWMFCILAFLKIAQRCDSYLAALGLNVAQTGSSMGMEMLMAARVLGGFGGVTSKSAGNIFRNGTSTAAAGAAGAAGGFMAGFTSKFKPNSYVRDAVTQGGTRMGVEGGIGFVGRAFGAVAARNGAVLSGESISSVALKPAHVSGKIGGDIANQSLSSYLPQFIGSQLSKTQISGGYISTVSTDAAGKTAEVELFHTDQYAKPDMPHTIVTASDGSQWYQMANGEGKGNFFPTPDLHGTPDESAAVAELFPSAAEGTCLRTVDEGVLEANMPDGSNALWYSSAFYQEPDALHAVMAGADGTSWYALTPNAAMPEFVSGEGSYMYPQMHGADTMPPVDEGSNLYHQMQNAGTTPLAGDNSLNTQPYTMASAPESSIGESTITAGAMNTHEMSEVRNDMSMDASSFNRALFHQFMPSYTQAISDLDFSRRSEGMLEVRHSDGSGTMFYDKTMYTAPKGEFKTYEDNKGNQWYAIAGTPVVENRPVYQEGKPVYDGDVLRTVKTENVRYKTTLTRFSVPDKRAVTANKPPKKK